MKKARTHMALRVLAKRKFYWALQVLIILGAGYLGVQLVNCYVQTHSLRGTFHCFTGLPDAARISEGVKEPTPDPREQLPKTLDDSMLISLPASTSGVIAEDVRDLEAAWFQKYGILLKVLMMVLVGTALIFYEIFRRNRRQLLLETETLAVPPELDEAPASERLPEAQLPVQLYSESAFQHAIQALETETRAHATRYLVLLEKQHPRDHLAMLYDQVILELTKKGVALERYYFEDDPRLCWKEHQYVDEVSLEELLTRYAAYPSRGLVLVGDADTFFEPLSTSWAQWTRALEKWEKVTLVTSRNPLCWGRKEERLSERFALLPATLEALEKIGEVLAGETTPSPRYWLGQNLYPIPPGGRQGDWVEVLQTYADTWFDGTSPRYEKGSGKELFEWLCALSLAPDLSWDLTLSLGKALSTERTNLLSPQNLAKLLRLPWFREGCLPEEVREQLIDRLRPERERIARKEIIRVLLANMPKAGTEQETEHRLNLALQRAHLEPNFRTRLALIQRARDFALNHELTDRVTMRELDDWSSGGLGMPRWMRKALFYQGLVSLGLRTWVRASATTIIILLLYLNLGPTRLNQIEQFGGRDYYLKDKRARMRFHTYLGNVYAADSNDYALARQNYQRAIQFKETLADSVYLKPDYNLAVLELESGKVEEAKAKFATVQEQGDSLLATARISPAETDDTRSIVARSNLNQGLIALRGGDMEEAEVKINRAEDLLEAKYLQALMLLNRPKARVQARNYQPLELALEEIQEIYEQDPSFFEQKDSTYLNRLLDSLEVIYQNSSGNVWVERIRKALEGDTVQKIPAPQNDPNTIQLLDGTDIVLLDQIGPLSEEDMFLVRIRESGNYGFVDANTNQLIARNFDHAQNFSQGRAAVMQKGKWGFIDTAADMVVSPMYQDVRDFEQTTYGLTYATVKKGGKWGVIDVEGTEIVPFLSERPIVFSKTTPLAAVLVDGKYGYVNPAGRMMIEPRFERAAPFFQGVARVRSRGYLTEINSRGEYVGNNPPPEKWDAQEVRVINEHRGSVNDVQLAPFGRFMATASFDSTAKIWRDNGKVLVASLRGHRDWVRSASFGYPQGPGNDPLVVTASKDGTARVWDLKGDEQQTLSGAQGPLWHAAFSPDGKLVATGSEDQNVRIYDWKAGRELARLDAHQGGVNYVEFSTSGDTLLTASEDGTVRLWSRSRGWTSLKTFDAGSPVLAAHMSPNGRFLSAACKDHNARLWGIEAGVVRIFSSHTDWVSDAVFSPDSRYLVTTSYDQSAKAWNLDGQVILDIRKHRSAVRSAAFAPDGKHVLTASWDRTVRVWKIEVR